MLNLFRWTCAGSAVVVCTFSATTVGAQLLPAELYDVGVGATSLAVGDMNADGLPDLVVGNPVTPQHIRILTNAGSGTFEAFTTIGNYTPREIALADVDGNGFLDIIWSDSSDLGIYVLKGSGTTIFAPVTIYPVGSAAYALAIADATGDGMLDIIFAGANDAGLLVGNGDGTFETPWLAIPLEAPPNDIATGDFNGDNVLDFATLYTHNNHAVVLLGTGGGNFAPEMTYPVGTDPSGVVVGDVNGDGILDLVVAHFGSHDVFVLFGDGSGSFSQGPILLAVNSPIAPRIGDFNADGLQDIAVANRFAFSVSLFAGKGGGSFEPGLSFPTGGAHAWEMQAGDLDSNGIPDFVTANASSVSVLLASSNACGLIVQSTEAVRLGAPSNPNALRPGATSGPVVGATWDPYIDHSVFVPSALVDMLIVGIAPVNLQLPGYGTLLCDLSAPNVQVFVLAGTPFLLPVPIDCTLVGIEACCQGASVSISGTTLTNALDISVGTY